MITQKKANRVVHVSEFVVDVWDGLDECEISRPEILSQSAFGLAIVLNCNTCFGMLNNGQVCFSRSLILILA